MAILTQSTGALLFTIIQFMVWVFAFVATPIAQFETPGHGCFTWWGYRSWCGNVAYDRRGAEAFPCPQRRSTMACGAAFGVISSITTFAALITAFLANTRIKCPPVIAFAFSAVSCFTMLIAWACTAAVYNMTMCGETFKGQYPYSAGFALMVCAWCMECINLCMYAMFACGEPVPEEEEEELADK